MRCSGAYVRLEELTVRSQLLVSVAEGEIAARPLGVLARLPAKGEVEVFNLSIEGEEQNYFAEGILVHNKSPLDQGGSGGTLTTSSGGSGGTAGSGGETGGRGGAGGSGGGHAGTGGHGRRRRRPRWSRRRATGGTGGTTGGTGGM